MSHMNEFRYKQTNKQINKQTNKQTNKQSKQRSKEAKQFVIDARSARTSSSTRMHESCYARRSLYDMPHVNESTRHVTHEGVTPHTHTGVRERCTIYQRNFHNTYARVSSHTINCATPHHTRRNHHITTHALPATTSSSTRTHQSCNITYTPVL